ncbi:MAG: hypothetical protein J6D53_02085 [Blautia sp.]|nr:hypothetical protein [Blautia sp.]
MFWDRVSGIYDLFGKIYNGKVNREMCTAVVKEIKTDDRVLECACGTGLITAAVAGKCRELVATDYSDGRVPCAVAVISKQGKSPIPSRDTFLTKKRFKIFMKMCKEIAKFDLIK